MTLPNGREVPNLFESDGSLISYQPQPQPYVLLANSLGERRVRKEGLSTVECFRFLLDTKRANPNSIFVGFGFNYDVNQILKDIPVGDPYNSWHKDGHGSGLWRLHNINETDFGNYYIKWYPRKYINITHRRTRQSVILYDTIGFFQSSFLEACRKYLGSDDLTLIERGKSNRSTFKWEDMEEFIIPYNDMELDMLVRVMNKLRADLAAVGVYPSQWHGPGAVASKVLTTRRIPIVRDIPTEVNHAAQFALAGGRFEQYGLGHYQGPVFEYDIHSAYPAAATLLPDLSHGYWEYVEAFEPGTFGVWHVEYCSRDGDRHNGPQPLFCRSEHQTISYPRETYGWYWTPEAELCPDSVREGWVFRQSNGNRPFDFIPNMYRQRLEFQRAGNSAERALKLILNSIYGKLAQTVGGKNGLPPRWHQLEYAGYITSHCRGQIYRAIQLDPEAIIATETDAVFSKRPLPLPVSDKLGEWELKEFTSIVYIQSGYYYAVTDEDPPSDTPIEATSYDGAYVICKYRGMDVDRETKQPLGLPYRTVLDNLSKSMGPNPWATPSLHSYSTRYNGLGLGLRTSAVWRSWEKLDKSISPDGDGRSSKRFHLREYCPQCQAGAALGDCLHDLKIGGHSGKSEKRTLPWDEDEDEFPMREYANDMERWQ